MEDDLPFADSRCMDLDNRIGASLSTDYFLLRTEFTARPAGLPAPGPARFVEQEVLPEINDYWERAEFPWPLIEKLGDGRHRRRRHRGLRLPGHRPAVRRA